MTCMLGSDFILTYNPNMRFVSTSLNLVNQCISKLLLSYVFDHSLSIHGSRLHGMHSQPKLWPHIYPFCELKLVADSAKRVPKRVPVGKGLMK